MTRLIRFSSNDHSLALGTTRSSITTPLFPLDLQLSRTLKSSAETAAYAHNNVAEENLGGIVLTVAEQLMPPVGERNRNLTDRSNIEGLVISHS